jgi:predicted RNase H-like HicB family nuclease
MFTRQDFSQASVCGPYENKSDPFSLSSAQRQPRERALFAPVGQQLAKGHRDAAVGALDEARSGLAPQVTGLTAASSATRDGSSDCPRGASGTSCARRASHRFLARDPPARQPLLDAPSATIPAVIRIGAHHMELTAVLTLAEEGGYIALNPETGTTTQGETVEEAVANLREATALYLEEFPLVSLGHPVVTTFSLPEHA